MSTTSPAGVRQRGGKDKKRGTTPQPDGLTNGTASDKLEGVKRGAKDAVTNDWDYKLAFAVITVLAFVTRFYGISHPNQVVFDEVHFGKVSVQQMHKGIAQRLLTDFVTSSLPTTSKGPTSSTSTLLLASYSSLSLAGWSATMVLFTSRTLAIRTLQTKSLTWRTGQCLP